MLNPDDIAQVFNDAGIDTTAKLRTVVQGLAENNELAAIDAELASLSAKAAEAAKPINDRRLELQNKRAEIAAAIRERTGK